MIVKLLLAGFLLAHAGIHASFASPRPPARKSAPAWPFDLSRSWLLTPLGFGARATRPLGIGLLGLTLAGLGFGGMVALGFLPAGLWSPAIVVGAVASLGLLVLFFHRWLILGLAIDAALLRAVLVAGWTPATA